jgi:hypothetical protein
MDRVGPEVATYTKKPVQYLGDGCYVSDKTVVACSIDSLPAGELACGVEPNENGRVVEMANSRWRRGEREYFYDSNLDSFVDRLNTHRCHTRWYDSLEAAPLAFTIRDVRKSHSPHFVPLAALSLSELPAKLDVSRAAAREACRHEDTSRSFLAPICVDTEGGVRVVMDLLRAGFGDIPTNDPCAFQTCWLSSELAPALASVRGAPGERQRCAIVEVTTSPLECRSVPR